jgi:hypothetical protein
MAKNLLLTVLVKVLGKYVEGLTNENLEIGVFSGHIELNNLKLKDSALDQFELPIQVKKGCLKHLCVSIPWTQLDSRPVEIEIDGVYLLATPLDIAQCTPEISRNMVYASKQKKLQEIHENILGMLKEEEEKQKRAIAAAADEPPKATSSASVSYVQQLVTSIIDNLEIKLKNIHIRYEDSAADYGQLFCAGLTLDELLLTTCDDTWGTNKLIKRDAADIAQGVVRKIGKIVNCGIYWNSSGESHLLKSDKEWEEFYSQALPTAPKVVTISNWQRHKKNILWFWLFLVTVTYMITGSVVGIAIATGFVAYTATRPVKPTNEVPVAVVPSPNEQQIKHHEQQQYILAPPNNLTLKITHRPNCTESLPKVDVILESSEMPFTVDKDQLRQFMALKKSFSDLDRKLQIAMYRPSCRPNQGQSAREWWKYAYRLITGHDVGISNKVCHDSSSSIMKSSNYIVLQWLDQNNESLRVVKEQIYYLYKRKPCSKCTRSK